MSNRLLVGKALGRLLPGPIPIADGLLRQLGVRHMAGEHFRTVGGDVWELTFQRLCDARVQLLAPALEQAVVGGLLDQGVLERVGRLGCCPAAKDQLGRDQLVKSIVQSLFWEK